MVDPALNGARRLIAKSKAGVKAARKSRAVSKPQVIKKSTGEVVTKAPSFSRVFSASRRAESLLRTQQFGEGYTFTKEDLLKKIGKQEKMSDKPRVEGSNELNPLCRSYRSCHRFLRSIPQSRKISAGFGGPSSRVRNNRETVAAAKNRGSQPSARSIALGKIYEKNGWQVCGFCVCSFRTQVELRTHKFGRKHKIKEFIGEVPDIAFCPCDKWIKKLGPLHKLRHFENCPQGIKVLKNTPFGPKSVLD